MRNKRVRILSVVLLSLALSGCQRSSDPVPQTENESIKNVFSVEDQEAVKGQETTEGKDASETGSQEGGAYVYHAESEASELGLLFSLKNITPSGAVLVFDQYDSEAPTGELEFGDDFELEVQKNGKWESVPVAVEGEIAFNDIAHIIAPGQSTEAELNWEWLYGELPAGEYRIGKVIHDFRGTGDFDKYTVYAHFILNFVGEGGKEDMERDAISAMYIPFGEDGHIFVGEQGGVFTATFPEEIYDIDGKKITREQLVRGNTVKIYGNGIMLESYPGQYPGITRMEVTDQGAPSDADKYQYLVDEIYTEPDPAEPPIMNLKYSTELAKVVVAVNRGGYEWTYTDEDHLSNAVVADSVSVLQWKVGEELVDVKIAEPLDITLYFSKMPEEVEAVRCDSALLGTADVPKGEKISVTKRDGEFVLTGVTSGYVYDVTGIWENGRANYGFITVE